MRNIICNLIKKFCQNKLMIQNLSYLSVLQMFNMLVPLFTFPYLIHILGRDLYGLIIFAQASISYLVILVNFGFNTLAIKEISIHRDNKEKLSSIVSNVLILKFSLFIISFGILLVALKFIPQAKGYESLFILTMWMCLYDFIFPIWYFQGIEKMKYITFLNLTSRLAFVLLIFVFIRSQKDFLLVPIINGIGAIISGIAGLYIVFKLHQVKLKYSSWSELKEVLNKSFSYFISEVSIKIFASSNKIIIGSALGMAEVAYYDLAEKVITIFRSVPLGIVRDTIFPRVAKTKNIRIVTYTTWIMGIYSIIAITFILIYAPRIVTFIGGPDMLPSTNILRIFSIIIFTTHISNYYITVGLWSFGYEKTFRNLMIYSSLTYLLFYGIFWSVGLINLYIITAIPILVDFYLIIHTYIIYKRKNII